MKLNLSEEKIKKMKDFKEKYSQCVNYTYEENCSFEMLEFLNESSYLSLEEKRLVAEKVKELNESYKYVVDNKFIVVYSKKYNRKLVTAIFYINFQNKEKCYCVDLEILGNKLLVDEKLITLKDMIEVKTTLTEEEKLTEIVIGGTKDIQARDFRIRVYSYYNIFQVDEEELEFFKNFEIEELENPYNERMSVIERFKDKEGNVHIKNLINEYDFLFEVEDNSKALNNDYYTSEEEFQKYIEQLISQKKAK